MSPATAVPSPQLAALADGHDVQRLRAWATQRLHDAASTGTRTALGPPAIEVLMRLAASPEHAADALLLLQELQVHQLEIDALSEELKQHQHPA